MQTSGGFRKILGIRVDAASYRSTCDRIQQRISTKPSCYIVAANVHVLMTTYWQSAYRRVLQQAALIIPDGMPL
ncbi:MAG: glycosyltransferase, partial [Leptolyngbya sp. SIO4C1]|nr:glycosyltransferase [Leptolyngbya sp. SIO4C1]